MLSKIIHWIKNQSQGEFRIRLLAGLSLILMLAFGIVITIFWRHHPSIGFDADYDSGRILQIFLGYEGYEMVNLDDRVILVNGRPASEFDPLRDLHVNEIYTITLQSLNGEEREITRKAICPEGLFLGEYSVFPFVGFLFLFFGVLLIMIMPVNRTTVTFWIYILFSSILFYLFNVESYVQGGTGFFTYLIMILVVLAAIEFHWVFLNIQMSKNLLYAIRWLIGFFILIYLFFYFVMPSSPILMQKVIFYVFWIFSFLFILFLFTIQYVYDELSRGMLRILMLTFFAGLGPMIYFVLLPLILHNPRSMPSIVSIIPMLLLPVNYFLMIQRKKQYARLTCTILSFMLTLLVVYFFVEVGLTVMEGWIPGFQLSQKDWFSQILLAGMIGIGIILYHYVYRFVYQFVYGDASLEAREMQQMSIDLLQAEDTNAILVKTGQVFQKFFDFDYLKVSLQDGTCLEFDEVRQARITTVDRIAVMSVINRITFRNSGKSQSSQQSAFIDLDSIHDLIVEYGQIFGDDPEYVFLIDGRSYPVGVISAGTRKNGERFDQLEISQLDALLGQYQTIVENLFLMDEVEKRSQQVRKMGQQLLEAREDERKRIARDMHDNIIQSLTAFRYQMNDLYDKDKLAISDEEADTLQRSLQVISQDIRDICFNLRPPALDATGFRSAVVSIVDSHHRNNHMNIQLDMTDSAVIDQLSDMVSICLYRVLQEALVNVERHAHTESIWISLDATEDFVHLRVEDNGVGFDAPEHLGELVSDGHYGLIGIQEFLEIVNGSLNIHSRRGEGSQLIARIPLERKGEGNELFFDYRR